MVLNIRENSDDCTMRKTALKKRRRFAGSVQLLEASFY